MCGWVDTRPRGSGVGLEAVLAVEQEYEDELAISGRVYGRLGKREYLRLVDLVAVRKKGMMHAILVRGGWGCAMMMGVDTEGDRSG